MSQISTLQSHLVTGWMLGTTEGTGVLRVPADPTPGLSGQVSLLQSERDSAAALLGSVPRTACTLESGGRVSLPLGPLASVLGAPLLEEAARGVASYGSG